MIKIRRKNIRSLKPINILEVLILVLIILAVFLPNYHNGYSFAEMYGIIEIGDNSESTQKWIRMCLFNSCYLYVSPLLLAGWMIYVYFSIGETILIGIIAKIVHILCFSTIHFYFLFNNPDASFSSALIAVFSGIGVLSGLTEMYINREKFFHITKIA